MEIDSSNAAQAQGSQNQNQNQGEIKDLSFDLLETISNARNEHGIRTMDYLGYRQYCSSKVHRLRQLLSITHADSNHQPKSKSTSNQNKTSSKKGKGGKKAAGRRQNPASQSAAEKGKGNQFTKKQVKVEEVENDRPAQLLLFETERAWAHSQDLRNQSFEKDQDSKLRKQGLHRGSRSINWSTSLLSLLKALGSKINIITQSQATAYRLMMLGNSHFDKGNHEKALETLSLARVLLGRLAKCCETSKEEALANSFIDGMEAMIRFCCYNLGRETNVVDLDEVTKEVEGREIGEKWVEGWNELIEGLQKKEEENKGGKKETLEIDFNGKKIGIRNPELAEEIEKVRKQEEVLRGVENRDSEENLVGQKKSKKEKAQRQRLTHAQRNQKKRGGVNGNASTSTAKASTSKLTKSTSLNPFDSLLVSLTSASEVSSRLLSDHASALAKSHSGRYASAGDELKDAHEWIVYKLLALRIKRNETLIQEVQAKADKREKRAKERMVKRIEAVKQGKGNRVAGSNKKKIKRELKEPKKNGPGSKAKRPRSTPKTHKNRPGRSGTKALKAKRVAFRTQRLDSLTEEAANRRSYRLIPSLSRLLDSTSISLDSIADLGLCESNPDIASLIECKSYLNRSQILTTLTKGYHLSPSTISKEFKGTQSQITQAKIRVSKISLLLLERSKLAIRQSKQSLDLTEQEEVENLDGDFPRQVCNEKGEKIFEEESKEIEKQIKDCQRSLFLAMRDQGKPDSNTLMGLKGDGKGKSQQLGKDGLPNSKSAMAIRDLLTRYLQLDERELEDVSRIPATRIEEFEEEISQSASFVKKVPKTKASKGKAVAQPKKSQGTQPPASSSDDEADFRDAESPEAEVEDQEEEEEGEFNEADEFDEEEEVEEKGKEEVGGQGQRKGWLGGWFGRG